MTALAGRCVCGVVLEWVARNPDEHMRCFGLRWCGVCGEAAGFKRKCVPCRRRAFEAARRLRMLNPAYAAKTKAYHRAWVRKHRRDPRYRAHQNELAKRAAVRRRLKRAASYLRILAARRLRYATDPAVAEREREYSRRYKAARLAQKAVHETAASTHRGQRKQEAA